MALTRLLTIALHMLFGIIMGRHLGLARHAKMTGDGSATMQSTRGTQWGAARYYDIQVDWLDVRARPNAIGPACALMDKR